VPEISITIFSIFLPEPNVNIVVAGSELTGDEEYTNPPLTGVPN
jgi:hypothetical protein